jgi:hypothetical protein
MTEIFLKLIVWFIIVILFVFIGAYFVMLLWNYCMPEMFGVKPVTYKLTLAFMFLVKMIFSSNINIKNTNSTGMKK